MNVRAKVQCVGVTKHGDNAHVQFSAVVDGSDENKSFAKYTPSLQMDMNISDETPAAGAFEQGKSYYLDFTPAE